MHVLQQQLWMAHHLYGHMVTCTPTTITGELEDMVTCTLESPYDPTYSLLRKKDKSKNIFIPDVQGGASTCLTSVVTISEKQTEPLRQISHWEHNEVQVDHVCTFIRALVGNLDAIKRSVIESPTEEQRLAIESMNDYRPITLCMNYAPFSLSLFTSYLSNAKEADDKLIALKDKTKLFIFLDRQTLKNTLKPLLLRLQRRAIKGETVFPTLAISSSSMMNIDGDEADVGMVAELDYPPIKLHSSFDKSQLQSRGQCRFRKNDMVVLICDIVTNVLVDNTRQERKLLVGDHLKFVKKVLLGEGDDEPFIMHVEDKDNNEGKPKMDAKSMWEDTKKNFLPNYEKTFWQKLTKH